MSQIAASAPAARGFLYTANDRAVGEPGRRLRAVVGSACCRWGSGRTGAVNRMSAAVLGTTRIRQSSHGPATHRVLSPPIRDSILKPHEPDETAAPHCTDVKRNRRGNNR